MGLLTFDEEHKDHLSYLVTVPVEVLGEFGRISVEFLRKGINNKVYNNAAQKLKVDPVIVRKGVEGLMYLFMESAKRMLTEMDFLDSALTLGFNKDQQKELLSFYKDNETDLRQMLRVLTPSFPSYHNLEWRLDVNVASRCLHHQVNPMFLLKLHVNQTSSPSTIHLETDPVNLVHMTSVLEAALQEMKTQHCRRIARLIN